jgi:hypothetical protein
MTISKCYDFMKNAIISICAIILMISVTEMRGQNLSIDNLTTKKIQPRQFVEQHQSFQEDILGADYVVVISFNKIPSKAEMKTLQDAGIEIINYQSKNSYLAKVPTKIKFSELEKCGIKSLRKYIIKEKLSPGIREGRFPEWAVKTPGTVDVAILLTDNLESNRLQFIHSFNITHLQTPLRGGDLIIGRIAQSDLQILTASPMVAHVDAIEPAVERLNHENRTLQKVNVLQSNFVGARNLTGEGIYVGIGDGGELGSHIDFNERVTNYANGTYSSFGAHGDHVAGIVGGAGNIDPVHRGMAPSSNLIIQKTTSIVSNAQTYYDNHGMVMTNNSYGVGYNCETNGMYNYSSNNLDWQMREMPELLHVYAAGNSGYSVCGNYPDGYKSVLRYYQSAKNVLTVGNVRQSRELNGGSSKGPVADGRLKPEIVAIGSDVMSTGNNFNYYNGTGTSMASPSTVGTLTLLNERYRELNGGDAPKGGLMKAIACNTADDLGNIGPDYAYGFGLINGRRGAECIENNRYAAESISNEETRTFNITVPSGLGQLKVMLYWHDVEAPAYSAKTLINDLDLKLTNPSGANYVPWVLNYDTTHVTDLATRKVDTLNNIEQVTLDNPAAGIYTITVDGSSIPIGPQDFFIVYDFVATDLVLTFPYGEECIEPGSAQMIQWDTDVKNSSNFTIEFSDNGGATWDVVEADVDAGVRQYPWSVPSATTEEGLIRIMKNGSSETSQNLVPFYLLARPTSLLYTPICEGYIQLTWDAVPDVHFYEIYTLSGARMEVIDTVFSNTYLTGSLSVGESHWYAVRGMTNDGSKTERSIATRVIPQSGGVCPWDYDLSLVEISTIQVGRVNTSLALSNSELITITLKNLGINAIDSFEMSYQVNGGNLETELIYETLLSGDSMTKTFTTTANFSSPGTYQLNGFITIPEDVDVANNEIVGTYQVTQLSNSPISLPYQQNFEAISVASFTENIVGLAGIVEWDFLPDASGKLNFVNEGSNKCLELKDFSISATDEGLTTTLNMSNYVGIEDLELAFDYKYISPDIVGDGDFIYLRGSDSDVWIEAVELTAETDWTTVDKINLSRLLFDYGQQFSSSTQIHFSQGRNTGYVLDNINIISLAPASIELTSFTAEREGMDAILRWETASEFNNHRFEIQVAKTPLPLTDENFKHIGTVLGNGTTTTNHQYTFLDNSPLKSGYRYYRLKQIDLNENFMYSDIRSVDFGIFTEVVIFPNPFSTEINIMNLPEKGSLENVQILNTLGQVVFESVQVEDVKDLTIKLEEKIAPGIYFLNLFMTEATLTFPIIKSNN